MIPASGELLMTGPQGFDYGRLVQRAFRGLMAEVLARVAKEGLLGEHHFYIGFDTTHPGIDMPVWLRKRYPEKITIAIQYEYSDLVVLMDRFSIQLSFSNRPARLVVPFDAVLTFVDPSMGFGLKFDVRKSGDLMPVSIPSGRAKPDERTAEDSCDEIESDKGTKVINLDTFRNH